MREIPVLSAGGEDNILFLCKTMESKYLDSTVNEGKFCFNHPTVFNEWEEKDSAQYDKWDAHASYELTRIVADPPVDERTGKPNLDDGIQLPVKGELHLQNGFVKCTPICCFRCIREDELEVIGDEVYFSLGKIAERIKNEFKHDSYIIMPAGPFIDLFFDKVNELTAMKVVYQDTLNEYPFLPMEWKMRVIVEQLFRKDKKFEWQNEYRFILPSTKESPVFKYLGSIEDIAVCGNILDLAEKKCIYHLNRHV